MSSRVELCPATLSEALILFISRYDGAPTTLAQHRENAAYLINFFGPRRLEEFAGDAGGDLTRTFFESELTGRRGSSTREQDFKQPNVKYATGRGRLNTLRLALKEAHHSGGLLEMPAQWPIPRPGKHGHLTAIVRDPGKPRGPKRKFKPTWQIPAPPMSDPAGRPTLTTAMSWGEKVILINQRSKATKSATRDCWRKLLGWFGDRPLADFEGPPGYLLLRSFIEAEHDRGVKFVTIKKALKMLRALLVEGQCRGAIAALPPWPRLPYDGEPRTRYLTREEFSAIRAKCFPRLRLWIDICLWTAMHSSDVSTFTWGDVDLDKRVWLRRNTKVRKQPGWLPMPEPLYSALVEALAGLDAPPEPDALIVGWMFNFRKYMKQICESLQIETFCPLDLRRTCATWWIEGGGSKDALKTWMGHMSTSFMLDKHYIQTTNHMFASGISSLEVAPQEAKVRSAPTDSQPTDQYRQWP